MMPIHGEDRKKRLSLYLIGPTLWGVSSVVAKSLSSSDSLLLNWFNPLTLATLTLLLTLLFSDRKRMIISLKDLPYFFVLGFVGVAGASLPITTRSVRHAMWVPLF